MDPATNAQLEGFALAPSAAQPTVRQNNVTQISKRDATISGSQEESDAAGKGSEMISSDGDGVEGSEVRHGNRDVLASAAHRRQRYWARRRASPRASRTGLGRAKDKLGAVGGAIAPGTAVDRPADAGDGPVRGADCQCRSPKPCSATRCRRLTPTARHRRFGSCRRGRSGRSVTLSGRSTTQVLVGKTEVVSTVDVIATDFGRIKVIPSPLASCRRRLADRSGLSRGGLLPQLSGSI